MKLWNRIRRKLSNEVRVPEDYPTIQAVLDMCKETKATRTITIRVANGYTEQVKPLRRLPVWIRYGREFRVILDMKEYYAIILCNSK